MLADTFGSPEPSLRDRVPQRGRLRRPGDEVQLPDRALREPNERLRLQYKGIVAGTLSSGLSATVGHENAAGNGASR
ncbi:MAG: hypothetical protein R2746_06805 [Acidimicrobiales bacterium]